MNTLADLVIRAQAGDVEAYGRLVQATQTMAYAVALSVVRDSATAQEIPRTATRARDVMAFIFRHPVALRAA